MKINNITISEEKLAKLSNTLPEDVLRDEYEINGLSDIEISNLYGISQSWVCKLRKVYSISTDPKYRLRRNKLRFVTLTEQQNNFIFGSLFGDSCISVQKSGQGYWLCRHCIQQESYLLKKAELMKPFTAKVYYGERSFEKGGELFKYVDAKSFTHPYFTELRGKFYPDGIKRINSDLFKLLTPSGFAYWFFDDGSTTGYGFDITNYDSFFKTNKADAIDLFKNVLNLKVSINHSDDGEGKIHILKESYKTAKDYLMSEFVSCFEYKIPKNLREDNQQPSFEGNFIEGSTTEESLNSIKIEHDGNSYSDEVIYQNMPDTCNKQVMIQSELAGNCER